MSLGQCIAAIDGWNQTHGAEEAPEPPTWEEYEEMLENAVI